MTEIFPVFIFQSSLFCSATYKYLWFKYGLGQKYYAPQIRSDRVWTHDLQIMTIHFLSLGRLLINNICNKILKFIYPLQYDYLGNTINLLHIDQPCCAACSIGCDIICSIIMIEISPVMASILVLTSGQQQKNKKMSVLSIGQLTMVWHRIVQNNFSCYPLHCIACDIIYIIIIEIFPMYN